MQESYKLPNGKVTTSSRTYLTAWRRIYKPLEKSLGLRCYGFNPTLSFFSKDNPNLSIAIPLWLAERLNGKLSKK